MKNRYDDVMKALRCCADRVCRNCPLQGKPSCRETLAGLTWDMMYNLNAENEKLKKDNDRFADIGKMYSEIRAEAAIQAIESVEKIILDNTYPSSDNSLKPVTVFRPREGYRAIDGLKKRYKANIGTIDKKDKE